MLAISSCNGENGGTDIPPFVQVGDTIQLGMLDWIVLAVEDGRALVLSERVRSTNHHWSRSWLEDLTWEHSNIREYLNGEFFDATFSNVEQMRIIETNIINNDNPEYGTPGGNDARDRVFLLSIDEVERYMGDTAHPLVRDAILQGTTSHWWLRSPGSIPRCVAFVSRAIGGGVDMHGAGFGGDIDGVRPALWLNLQ